MRELRLDDFIVYERKRRSPRPKKGFQWSTLVGHRVVCLSCSKRIDSKPAPNCKFPKHAKNYDRVKAWHRGRYRPENDGKIKREVIELMGGKCSCVGIDCWHVGHCSVIDLRVLQINHINRGGSAEHKRTQGHIYRLIHSGKRRVDDLNILCSNCNITYENYIKKQRREVNPLPT